METGRISFLTIDRYAARYGMDLPDEFDRFQTMIAAMDGEFIKRMSTKTEGGYSVDVDDVSGIKSILTRLGKKAEEAGREA